MVRNTKGGKGAKSMARKNTRPSSSAFPVPTNELEHFAVVNKMFGPACEVFLLDGTKLLCHIRNKFKGRHKSGNLVTVGCILLVGFREWESETDRKNCDLLFVYDAQQTRVVADLYQLPSIHSLENTSTSNDIIFDQATDDTELEDTAVGSTDISSAILDFDDI
jgi:translation initiation factor IF-1